jgi:hypothetical protein
VSVMNVDSTTSWTETLADAMTVYIQVINTSFVCTYYGVHVERQLAPAGEINLSSSEMLLANGVFNQPAA